MRAFLKGLFQDALYFLTANKMPFFISGCCIILIFLFLYSLYALPAVRIGPEQPISFSHRVHAGVKQIQCEFCHPYVSRSSFPGIPPVEKCLFCHKYIIANHPEIKKEHHFFNTNTPTPWVKANYLPEHVFFNHQRHIKKEVACQECHGRVETMDRIKGENFKMGFCITCHKEKRQTWIAGWHAITSRVS